MKYADKFKSFLTDLANKHDDKSFFEGIAQAFDAIFEADRPKLGIDPNPSDPSGLGLHSRSDYTPADIAKAKNAGEYGNLVDHNKEQRHKGMVGDSFVGHTGTSKAQEIAKRTAQELDTRSSQVYGELEPVANVMRKLFGNDTADEFGGINTGAMDLLKGRKLQTESDIAAFSAAKIKQALPFMPTKLLTRLIDADKNDVIADAAKIGIDKAALMNAFKNNKESKAEVNNIIFTGLIPKIKEIAGITNSEERAEIQQGYSQYNKFEPVTGEDMRATTRMNMEDIWTRGAKVNQIQKSAKETGMDKISATDAQKQAFIKKLVSDGFTQEQANATAIAMDQVKATVRRKLIEYAQRTQGGIVNQEISKKLTEYKTELMNKGQSEGDPNKYLNSFVKWPFQQEKGQGRGSKQQTLVKVLHEYVKKGIENPIIPELEKSLSQIGLSVRDVYNSIFAPLMGDRANTTFNSLKERISESIPDDAQKMALGLISVDDKAFADILPVAN